jgi:hypothetical protein
MRPSRSLEAIRCSWCLSSNVGGGRYEDMASAVGLRLARLRHSARIRLAIKQYPYPDWTDGCIALSNADMQALWDMVRVPIPIEIVP